MKHLGKLAVLGAVIAASAPFASADTINFASGTTTPVFFDGSILQPNGPYPMNPNTFVSTSTPAATVNITDNGVWTPAITGSSYVSEQAGTEPNGGVVDPNGYYTYSATINAVTGGAYTGTFSVLADDTVAIYLGAPNTITPASVPFILAGTIGSDAKCADGQPNCITQLNFTWSPTLAVGANVLTFVVEQTGLSAQGLDFAGSLTSVVPSITPEPSSLILLGTGLLGAAGALVRKRQAV
jgi:hypothetical protein